jgi:hypothetical protein
VLTNPNLEDDLFNLEEVNLAAVPGAVQEAIKQTALEGGGAVERIEIKRAVGMSGVPQKGDVRWMIAVRSPRETASAYADARGHVDRLDLSGTERARNVDFTEGGILLDQVVGQIRETFGGDKPVFVQFSLQSKRIWFQVRATEPPHRVKRQIGDLEGLHDDGYADVGLNQVIDKMQNKGPVTESQCFALDEIDWSKVPEMRKDAIEQMGGIGEISEINLHRRVGYASPLSVEWELITQGHGGEGFVQYDLKGKRVRFQLPSPSRYPNQLEPENARALLNSLRDDFGPETRLIGIELRKDQALVKVLAPDDPGKGQAYVYYLRGGMRLWSDAGVTRPDNDAQMINADEVSKVVDALEGLKQKALAQVGEQNAEIEYVSFYRYRPLAASKLLLIEFAMANNRSVIYDSTGRLVK